MDILSDKVEPEEELPLIQAVKGARGDGEEVPAAKVCEAGVVRADALIEEFHGSALWYNVPIP